VERCELTELHYITPTANVPSICEFGILSFLKAAKLDHESVAMTEIQSRRAHKAVPNGRPLHHYVNLYICARNPMLHSRLSSHERLCVVRVSPDVLSIPGAVVTTANASSDWGRFAAAPEGLRLVNRDLVFAEDWTDSNAIAYYQKKSAKCAEVLVPDRVDPRFLHGAYVSCTAALRHFDALGVPLVAEINKHMFFLEAAQ